MTGGRGAAVYAAAGLLPGTRVGHYVLQHELGRGGMGQVFLARDTKLDRKVAIKFVVMHNEAAVARFMAEAQVTARCTHPNIVVIHDISEHLGVPYTVLEYVAGESVAASLRAGAMAPERVTAIMLQVARAVAAAHARGIIHRDLKPANILLAADGAVKVVDFGIAKHVAHRDLEGDGGDGAGRPPDRELTAADELVGTLHHLAPEQVRRDPVDARVDLWGFGVTMFHMLAGKRPFDGVPRGDVLQHLRDLETPTPRLDEVAPATPPALVAIVHRCLQKRVDRRVASAAELVAALEALPGSSPGPVTAGAEPRPGGKLVDEASEPTTRRHAPPGDRRWWLGAALVAIAAIAAGMWVGRRHEVGGGVPARSGPATPAAESRVASLFAEIDRLEGRNEPDAAARLYAAFVDDERDPAALTLAWLGHADRQRDRGQREAALDSYAAAYGRTSDPAAQRRALLELSAIYRERWEWDRLTAAIDVHDRTAGPADPRELALRDQALLAARSQAAARSPATATAAVAGSLLVGRHLDLTAAEVTTVDLDRDGAHELISLEAGALIVRSGDGVRELSRRAAAGADSLRCVGRDAAGAWAVVAPSPSAGRGWQLLDLAGSRAPVGLDALAATTRDHCYAIDVDGDLRDELYLVGDNSLVQLVPRPRAERGWTARPIALGSQVGDVIGGDLDGDGRGELVISVGEWRAYDVRVLRPGPDGELHLADRVRLGVVTHLADLGRDREGRALVAAIKEDTYPSVRELPADRPNGAAAGLYVFAIAGSGLELLRRIELPIPPGEPPAFGPLRPVDFDGDGVRDLLAAATVGARHDMVVMHGRPDGGFDISVVGGVTPLGVASTDADRADEILARLDDEPGLWLLGAGDVAVPAVHVARRADAPTGPGARGDAVTTDAWRRAEELARVGRVEAAVDALRRIATVGPNPAVKTDALRRAAALLHAHGLPATSTYAALAELEAPGSRARLDALLAAAEEHAARLEVAAARRLVDEATTAATLTVAERARLAVLRDELAVAPLLVFAGEPLAPPWRVHDPALVNVVPGSRRLTVETLVPGPVVSMALTRKADLVTLAFDAEITRTEWAGSVRVRLGPSDRTAPGAVFVEIGGRGGGGIFQRRRLCGLEAVGAVARATPLVDADGVAVVHVEVAARPAQGRGHCAIVVDGVTASAAFAATTSARGANPGLDWELSIEGGGDAIMTSASVRFASITISGFAAATPGTPSAGDAAIDDAALALAGHRPVHARAALAALPRPVATTWRARRLAILAAEMAGDRNGAVAHLAAALVAAAPQRPIDAQLAILIRARDGQFAPLVRAALGGRIAPALHAAWANVAAHDLDEPRVRTALIRDLADLLSPTPTTAAATLALGGFLGEALLAAGRPDDGRRALTDALGRLPADAAPEVRDRAARIAVLLAIDAATNGDAASARAWGLRALDLGEPPELVADRLLRHPATAALASDPAWARVVAIGRTLAAPP